MIFLKKKGNELMKIKIDMWELVRTTNTVLCLVMPFSRKN